MQEPRTAPTKCSHSAVFAMKPTISLGVGCELPSPLAMLPVVPSGDQLHWHWPEASQSLPCTFFVRQGDKRCSLYDCRFAFALGAALAPYQAAEIGRLLLHLNTTTI